MKIVKNLCNEVNLEDKCCKLCYRLIESYFNGTIVYGIEVENDDDEEIIAITLQMILAMRKKERKLIFPE